MHLTPEASLDRLFQGVAPSFVPYHWHGDVFDLPGGAVSLARSELTEHQAFRYGERVYGLLFHLEVTREVITGMVKSFAGELKEEDMDGETILAQATERLGPLHTIGQAVFARLGRVRLILTGITERSMWGRRCRGRPSSPDGEARRWPPP